MYIFMSQVFFPPPFYAQVVYEHGRKFSVTFEWDNVPRNSSTVKSISVCMFYFEAQSKSYKINCSFVISTKISAARRRAGQLKASSLRPLIFNSSFVCDCGFDWLLYTSTGYTLEGIPFHRSSHMFSCVGFSRTTQTLHLIYFPPLFCPFSLPSLAFLFICNFSLIFSMRL